VATSLVKVLIHLVFSTKERVPFINASLQAELYPYMAAIIRHKGGIPLALGGMPDHVHILFRLKADTRLSDLLRDLKAGSSKWVHEKQDPMPEFKWQMGYAAFSVSPSNEAKVKAYILNQEAHHRKKSFKEELIELLDKHGVEYDPEYIFR
jgi:putative transposase